MLARVVMTWSCEDLPGFGVGVYSDIDPRARALLTITSKHIAANPAVAVADSIMKSVRKLTRQHPSYFFAVVYACRAAGLPPEAPLALIAIGRTVGWIAHIIEHTAQPSSPGLHATLGFCRHDVYQSHDYICRAWARKISLAPVEGSHFVKRGP